MSGWNVALIVMKNVRIGRINPYSPSPNSRLKLYSPVVGSTFVIDQVLNPSVFGSFSKAYSFSAVLDGFVDAA